MANSTVSLEDSDHNTFEGSAANTDVIASSVDAIIRAANEALKHQQLTKKEIKK